MNKVIAQYIVTHMGIHKKVLKTKGGKYFVDTGHVLTEMNPSLAEELIKENYNI